MYECYTLEVEGAGVRFAPREGKELAYLPGQPPKGYTLVNVIGDPGLLHCAVFRKDGGAGGFFALHDTEGVLFMAVAESNLAYGMGLAHMGRMVTYARYGQIFLKNLAKVMTEKPLPPLVAARSLGVVFFPAFDWAISATHPEREERLLYTRDQLLEEGLFDIPGITEYRPAFATHAQLERAHFCLPSAAAVSTDSHLASAGGAIRAARLVLEGREQRAFALVRPPGHHAMRVVHGNRGFCNINNEAVMVEYIRDHYPRPDGRPLRIAIVDTDVHHGDGSQDIFWNDPHTLFISLHQDGRTLYPGSGFPQECGGPGALGRTINIPLPPETSDEGYLYAIEHAVLPILEDFKPDLIINSAGQDNHFTDPLANMKLSAQGYAALNAALQPHIAVLEGGYSIRGALPYVNLGICLALAGLDASDIREPGWTPEATRQRPQVGEYIARLCGQIRDVYFHPPAQPTEGEEENGWWVRRKHIFYDTDNLREGQTEAWRLCSDCSGLGRIETASERVPRSLCILVPRHACPQCRSQGLELAEQARKSGRYAHVRLLDGDAADPGSAAKSEK